MNHDNKIITFALGLITCGLIIWIAYPFVSAFIRVAREKLNREDKDNYMYVYSIPPTKLFLHTYYHEDSLCVLFAKNDTTIANGSYFKVRYFPNLTNIVMEVVNDSLVYLADHNGDVTDIYNYDITIKHISKGFYNLEYYETRYTEDSHVYSVFKQPRDARVSIYSGIVEVNDSIIHPIVSKYIKIR